MKKLIAASIAVMFAVTGCNTVKGFGKDVSKTGDAVTNTAQSLLSQGFSRLPVAVTLSNSVTFSALVTQLLPKLLLE